MDKEKNEDSVKKLEKEFHDFQKQWVKFLTNDFHHLVVDVGGLKTDVGTLIKQNDGMQQNIKTMEKNILKALGARAYDWVGGKVPPEGKQS